MLNGLRGLGSLLRLEPEPPGTKVKAKLHPGPGTELAAQGAVKHGAVVGADGPDDIVLQDGGDVLLIGIRRQEHHVHAPDSLRNPDGFVQPGNRHQPHALSGEQFRHRYVAQPIGVGLQHRDKRRPARLFVENTVIGQNPVGLYKQVHERPLVSNVKFRRKSPLPPIA